MATLDQLKSKYQSVIDYAKSRGVHLTNVHMEGEKLQIKGAAPNQDVKNEVWDKIKAVDPVHGDIAADITIDASLKVPEEFYTVAAGDSLSKIAKKYYGDANQYMKIFEANKDQLKDPDEINVGQKLRIPR
jgi:nucleoid-associated protein YgaU